MRIQSIVAIPTDTTKITCGGRTGKNACAYCKKRKKEKKKDIGVNAENVSKISEELLQIAEHRSCGEIEVRRSLSWTREDWEDSY